MLDPALRGRDLTTTRISVSDATLLRSDGPIDVFVLTENGHAGRDACSRRVAPHGYNAAINLLVGVSPRATVTGVRAVRHRETTGLGDAIDIAKSALDRAVRRQDAARAGVRLWAVDRTTASSTRSRARP